MSTYATKPDTDQAEKPERKVDKAKVLAQAIKRYKLASQYWQKQRLREKDDLRFQVPELQWDDDAKRSRLGDTIAGVPVPPRPILSISQLDQPKQLVINQFRAAKLGVNIHPLSSDASDETAEIKQGIYRQIERDSQAEHARFWAFDRAVQAGMGAYRVNTCYDENGANPFDQVIRIERILYQDAVLLDPSAQKPDFSDGEYAFVTEWVPVNKFKDKYPDAELAQAEDLDLESTIREAPEWIKGEGEDQAVLVAEHFYKEYETHTFVTLEDGSVVDQEEMEEGDLGSQLAPVDPKGPKREKTVCVVYWCKLTAGEIIEGPQEWNGHYIPIIPVIGRELQPFDAERRWTGMIGPAKDSQRLFNYAVSTAVEVAALEPKAPWIGAEGQFEGHESQWQQSNMRNFPYLEYRMKTLGQQPAPPPQRVQVDGSKLGVNMQLMEIGKNGVQTATAVFDPGLGNVDPQNRSGKAVLALQNQGDAGNSHYMHNMADISMSYEALVILDLMPAIYDRKGRLARTLDEEGESDVVMLNQPHYSDPQSGRPVGLQEGQQPPMAPPQPQPMGMAPGAPSMPPQGPPGMPPGPGMPPMPPQPLPVKHYDLSKGAYGVEVTIGKSWDSRLQQGAEEIGQILQSQPNLMPVIGPLYFKYRDFPGAPEIAELLKKVRDKQMPELAQDDSGQPSPEALQAQLQSAQQHIQMLQGQLQQAGQIIQTKQVEHGAKTQQVQIKSQSDMEIAQLKAQVQLILAKIEADSKARDIGLQHGHEADQAQQQAAHDLGMQAHAQAGAQAAALAKPPIAPYTVSDQMPLGSEEGV